MANFNINEADELKNKIIKASEKGPRYFFKNALLIVLVLLGVYIVSKPEILFNPSQFVENFDSSSIYSFVFLAAIVIGVFQLGRSIIYDQRMNREAEDEFKDKRQQKEHNEEIIRRIQKNPEISNILKDILINLNATRATVCEMHNGTNTLAGVPFVHLTMTYEEISNEVDYSSEDYNNINMSRMPFVSKYFKKGYWIGPTEDIEKEDGYLGEKLKRNNDNYMGFVIMHGKKEVLGVLTVAFKDKDPKLADIEISNQLMIASQKLSILLDK